MTKLLDYAPPVSTQGWISRTEAAERLEVSLQTIDRYVSRGVVASRKNDLTRRVLLNADDVDRVKRQRESAP